MKPFLPPLMPPTGLKGRREVSVSHLRAGGAGERAYAARGVGTKGRTAVRIIMRPLIAASMK